MSPMQTPLAMGEHHDEYPLSIDKSTIQTRLSEVFHKDEIIPLQEIIQPIISVCVEQTTSGHPLALVLHQEKLITQAEYIIYKNKPDDFHKQDYLYNEVLKMKVKRKIQYKWLFEALLDSGNGHIVEKLLGTLRTRPSNPPATESSANEINTPSDSPSQESDSLLPTNIEIGAHSVDPSEPGVVNDFRVQICRSENVDEVQKPCTPSNICWQTTVIFLTVALLGAVGTVGTFIVTSNAKNDQLSSTLLIPTETGTQSEPKRSSTLPERLETYSRNKTTTRPKKIRLSIGAPTDMQDLPNAEDIHLTINNTNGVPWENWSPQNADKVMSLKLYGTFSLPEIRHFLSIMDKVTSLCIYNSNELSCRKNIRKKSNELSNESSHLSAGISEARSITSHPKNIQFVTIGSPTDLPNLPERGELHLKISSSEELLWENWTPQNVKNVTLLRLNGTFSPSDIKHFLSIMSNLNTLCFDKLIGKFCDESLEENLIFT
ncbi:unnamed protein product [Allacma fusca]|uniref:Uncharacterized protein n=1 Tax=Allacma fusca TaxID=39272 RepID=A0A8J2KEJ7_9HEXA|nr:unnamed protein product [Allacma fusca]